MSPKNISMEIKTEQFEVLENDIAMQLDGGADAHGRESSNTFFDGIVKIINFFTGK